MIVTSGTSASIIVRRCVGIVDSLMSFLRQAETSLVRGTLLPPRLLRTDSTASFFLALAPEGVESSSPLLDFADLGVCPLLDVFSSSDFLGRPGFLLTGVS